mgnify:CR=1 FL=1
MDFVLKNGVGRVSEKCNTIDRDGGVVSIEWFWSDDDYIDNNEDLEDHEGLEDYISFAGDCFGNHFLFVSTGKVCWYSHDGCEIDGFIESKSIDCLYEINENFLSFINELGPSGLDE